MIDHGQPLTGFMKFGDRIRIEALDSEGESVFGAIDQRLVDSTLLTQEALS
jgi:fumarylacetoacetate (FAA) hydrolase